MPNGLLKNDIDMRLDAAGSGYSEVLSHYLQRLPIHVVIIIARDLIGTLAAAPADQLHVDQPKFAAYNNQPAIHVARLERLFHQVKPPVRR